MSSGPFGSMLGTKDYLSSGVPVIRGKNIKNGEFIDADFVYVSKQKADELKRSTAKPEDVVTVAVGSSGSSAIVPKSIPFAILSQNCNKITLDAKLALSEFVNYFLQLDMAQNQLADKTTDTARPFLSLTNLKQMLIPLPPLPEQQFIVETIHKKLLELKKIEPLIDEIIYKQERNDEFLDNLKNNVLDSAFLGKLVN
jgi:type I restriction enzyme S subunit